MVGLAEAVGTQQLVVRVEDCLVPAGVDQADRLGRVVREDDRAGPAGLPG